PNLAAALNNLGACYREVGRRHDALAPAEQATRIYCALAGDNPAHLPNLASALTNLGNCYAQVGRPHDALAHTEQAVSIYQTQAANNPAHLPNLASALNNLGIHYRQVGRPHDALAHTEQAVTLYRTLAADNPAFLPDLAGVLTNLGACYRKVGRTHDAVAPTEEAISLYRAQAADNPAFLPDLAMALTNLGLRYVQVGRRHDAIAPTQQAVTLYRALAADNPAYLPDLAMALNNLGTCYAEVGRPHDAVTPTEQAVTLYRAQAADNPAHLPNLASALNNLGTCYTQVGRPHDAVTPTEQAVTLYRALAGDNPAHLPGLATALNNLGTCYTQVGVGDEIAHVWEQTIDLLPSVAAKAFLLIRRAEARPPSERVAAVRDLRRALRLVPRDEHRLVADCHATGRRLRALDPDAFDRVWPEALSPWLTLNQTHLDLTLEWIGTDTIEAEYAFFVAHVGELLGDATAVALDEIGLYQVDPTSVDVYRSLWDQARRGGVDEAYRLRLAGALLARWVDADLDAKREMLNERGDELLSTDVAEVLQTWREQDPEDDQLAIHEALLTLASAGHTATADPDHTAATAPADHTTAADTDHTAATAPADHTTAALTDHTAATAPADHTAAALTRHADAAFDALADPGRFPPLLNQLARAGADPAVLTAAATLARLATDRPQIQAAALFHLALALTRDGQTEEATATLHAAHAADPAQSTDWLRLLFELVPRHPELQALSSALLDCYSGHTAPE
ncbi:MAG: tetratricopeptide repeat protein, partial [Egibacteraceae bacterium]